MKRRLQVFVCSTYEDLRSERQAAVEAILKAGHIPAGMELFTAGSESQLKVIQQWIEDSDVFLLVLGGRYGSIEPTSGLSYIEVEFDFARQLSKPFFSVVITQEGLETKVKELGISAIEQNNAEKLQRFRDKVTSQLCAFFSSQQEIKLAVFETLPQFSDSISAGGWVKASEVTPSEDVAKQLTRLLDENGKLKIENDELKNAVATVRADRPDFSQLAKTLESENIKIRAALAGTKNAIKKTLLRLTIESSNELARGVSNSRQANEWEIFLFYNVASRLAAFGLAEHDRVPPNAMWQRLKLSKDGIKLVTRAKINIAARKQKQTETSEVPEASIDEPVQSRRVKDSRSK